MGVVFIADIVDCVPGTEVGGHYDSPQRVITPLCLNANIFNIQKYRKCIKNSSRLAAT